MAFIGLYTSYMALVDPDTQEILTGTDGLSTSGVIEIDKTYFGTSEASISNLAGKVNAITGNNQIQGEYQDPAQPEVAYTVNNLDFEIKQKILGYKNTGLGWVQGDSLPHVGLVVVSQTLDRANKIYYAFPNGVMTLTKLDLKSDTESKANFVQDALTFDAQSADSIGGKTHKTYIDSATSFGTDAMFKELWTNYTAATTTTTSGS